MDGRDCSEMTWKLKNPIHFIERKNKEEKNSCSSKENNFDFVCGVSHINGNKWNIGIQLHVASMTSGCMIDSGIH